MTRPDKMTSPQYKATPATRNSNVVRGQLPIGKNSATVLLLLWASLSFVQGFPNLIYLTANDLRIVNTSRSSKFNVIVDDLLEGVSLDLFYNKSMLIWADNGDNTLYSGTFTGTHVIDKKTILSGITVSENGLAFDWLTKKLYWSDQIFSRIEVASLDGKFQKILYWENLVQPHAIALAPMDGLMFWTDLGNDPKIERAGMNGDSYTRKIIANDKLFWPNGLTIDYSKKELYWIDGKLGFINVMDYDGNHRQTVLEKGIEYPFGISYCQDKLYYTDWKTWSINVMDRKSGQFREILHSRDVPMDIRVWDSSRQPHVNTPCDTDNGGCSDLCLLSSKSPGYSCACSTRVKLIDHYSCANGTEDVILLVEKMNIYQVSLDTPELSSITVPLPNLANAVNIDYDPIEENIYWTDEEVKTIQRVKIDGSNQENVIFNDIYCPFGIAIDWAAQNMYWTDSETAKIEIAKLNGKYRKVLISHNMEAPRSIALSSDLGLLFWSDWFDKVSKIERSNLDGSARKVILKDNLGWANGITLDVKSKILYFYDSKTEKIEEIDINGKNRRELVNTNLAHVFSLSVLNDYLYWTNWQYHTVERVNKNTGSDRKIVVSELQSLMGIKAINLKEPLNKNPCSYNNGNCSQFCFYKPMGNYICACEIGYELESNGKICVLSETFFVYSRFEQIGLLSTINNNYSDVIATSGLRRLGAVDIDIMNKQVYWTDIKRKTISKVFLNGSMPQKVIVSGLESPEGLAVDWIGRNLFWCDWGTNKIEVSRLDGSARRVLLQNDMKLPKNLLLNPKKGFMYWSEFNGITGSIYKSSMNGDGKHCLVHKTGEIISATLDYENDLIYWTSVMSNIRSIERIDLEGKGFKIILSVISGYPYAITYFKGYLYWLDWFNGTLFQVNTQNGTVMKKSKIHLNHVTHLMTYDRQNQMGTNPCSIDNGGCQHLCLVKGLSNINDSISHQCSCETHYRLVNNYTCLGPKSFLIVAQNYSFHRIVMDEFINDTSSFPMPVIGSKYIKAVEYDPVSKMMYWIDGNAQMIKRSFENGSEVNVFLDNINWCYSLYDLALDPYNKLLFWTCARSNTITATHLSHKYQGIIYKGYDINEPRNLAIHPEKSYIYWTDIGSQQKVIRSRIDGKNQIVIASDLLSLEALAIDRIQNILYFSHSNKIDVCDLDGNERRSLISMNNIQITNIAVLGSHLYLIDKEMQMVKRIHRYSNHINEEGVVMNQTAHVTDMVSVYVITPKILLSNPCSSINHHGRCSQFCVITPDDHRIMKNYECSCPLDFVMNDSECVKINENSSENANINENLNENLNLIVNANVHTNANEPVCNSQQFVCNTLNNTCMSMTLLCNGHEDCLDGSDEVECSKCYDQQFRCLDGRCLDRLMVCDGIRQCSDGSDEYEFCSSPQDKDNRFDHIFKTVFIVVISLSVICFIFLLIFFHIRNLNYSRSLNDDNVVTYRAISPSRNSFSELGYVTIQERNNTEMPEYSNSMDWSYIPTTSVASGINQYNSTNQYPQYEPHCSILRSQANLNYLPYNYDSDNELPCPPYPPPPSPDLDSIIMDSDYISD